MTPLDIARVHAERSESPVAFLHAYTRATQADAWDLDTESLILAAIRRDDTATAAGLIEGLAALHAAEGMPTHAAPIWRRLPTGGTA